MTDHLFTVHSLLGVFLYQILDEGYRVFGKVRREFNGGRFHLNQREGTFSIFFIVSFRLIW